MTNDHNSNSRFDIYTLIHKGLRSFMSDTLMAVGRIDESDTGEVAEGLAQVRRLLQICREDLFVENQFIHPAMEARRPGSARATLEDHVHHEETFERLEARILVVERSLGRKRKDALLILYRMLALFVADNFQHMNVEECENSEVLWSAYKDDELATIHKSIMAAVPPDLLRENVRWLLPNIPHADRVHLLTGVKHSMPANAFEGLLRLVKAHVTERDWSKLEGTLSPAATSA